ncbi:MAG: PAS domain-containing protein [Spartobacteria bacterium]|nr:PAS domain-containing protein [Spartobacteria bacterium]
MSIGTMALLMTAGINLLLGLLVFLTNTRRNVNQLFLLLCIHIALWTTCVLYVTRATTAFDAERWIRAAFFITALFPASIASIHLGIIHRGEAILHLFRRAGLFWGLNIGMGLLCLTPFFLNAVVMPASASVNGVPEAVYGNGFVVFVLYFLVASSGVGLKLKRSMGVCEGIQRTEQQFLLLAFLTTVVVGATLSLIIPLLSGVTQTSQYGPLSTLALTLIIAYGIAKYRIMEVAQFVRKGIAYTLLAGLLTLLYSSVWFASSRLLAFVGITGSVVPNFLATVAIILAMTPAYGALHRFAARLFLDSPELDVGETVHSVSKILKAITTLPELLENFSRTVQGVFQADHIALLLFSDQAFVQKFPLCAEPFPILRLPEKDSLVRQLRDQGEPVVTDTLCRHRPSAQRRQLAEKMISLKAAIAVGIRTRGALTGLVLLGPRTTGHIYGDLEQKALQILCDQLAVAIENSRLYTEARNREIYNKTLLDSLVSGVIAVNEQGLITVCNREAARIIRRIPAEALRQPFAILPEPLADLLRHTLASGQDARDIERVLHIDKESIPVNAGSAIFTDEHLNTLGALLVFHDQSRIKKLEFQVRRTDRLASVGTLSAGMAHEIKNPLVSIKTFSQLLPERYDDPDFRETFSSLLVDEVKRIDEIVNQLLHFARPAKPHLAPRNLHQVIDNSIRLVEQPIQQKGIQLERQFNAPRDLIQADAGQLDQAFINFFLNAIDAMEAKGRLRISTKLLENKWNEPLPFQSNGTRYIQVAIGDTGRGIDHDDLPNVFDPFFTTKTNGTGLGLSVAHGILTEHRASIDVHSERNRGTTFTIVFPLVEEEVTA